MSDVEFRLVCQLDKRTWGSNGLEWVERRYVLQFRDLGLLTSGWHTVRVVRFEELPRTEQDQMLRDLGVTG